MNALWKFWDSSLGKKTVMAVTGLAGVGFVVGHMVGNLQMFKGAGAADAMAAYAKLLRTSMPLLWAIRLGLLACVGLHITAALQLTARNRAARPQGYQQVKPQASTFASRTMLLGGVLLATFIVVHILDMTLGVAHPNFTHLDPYNNLVYGFQRPLMAGFYVLAMASLAAHLVHGAWASFRTLGLRKASERPLHRTVAVAVAVLVALGFMSVPIAVVTGVLKPQSGMGDMQASSR
ncbi:MAG: succinate dehydrogenase cytochrome b subunit [Gemmatimonadaceae bacterium]|jgi:succinate dehydrogenase / fumarate reductase cytochrome b subunit|nr:succinate dehydrogenase cytochrome b subunit [Gemmatimonadaceae bacterium]